MSKIFDRLFGIGKNAVQKAVREVDWKQVGQEVFSELTGMPQKDDDICSDCGIKHKPSWLRKNKGNFGLSKVCELCYVERCNEIDFDPDRYINIRDTEDERR